MSCCHLQKLQCTPIQEVQHWPSERPKYRAGVVFIDYERKKVLIVQSYQVHWGFPKGSKMDSETFLDCAIRELMEETGIKILKEDVDSTIQLYNGTVKYYFVRYSDRFRIDLSVIDTTEITGIGWICLECLKKKVQAEEILVNCHVRKLFAVIERKMISSIETPGV